MERGRGIAGRPLSEVCNDCQSLFLEKCSHRGIESICLVQVVHHFVTKMALKLHLIEGVLSFVQVAGPNRQYS